MLSKRIITEFQNLKREPIDGINISHKEDNLRYLFIKLNGPPGSPYEKGVFKLELFIHSKYPMEPPKIRFLTKMYHPNIDNLGRICLDILKDKWSPAMQIRTLLLSLLILLADPNIDDPLSPIIANHWMNDKEGAIHTAQEYTLKYAC